MTINKKNCLFFDATGDSIYNIANEVLATLKDIDTDIILKANDIFIVCDKNITKDEIVHQYCKALKWRE